MGKIVSIVNQKGGVGKTTTQINLAACCAQAGMCVLSVDMDPQANATSGMGLCAKEGRSVYEVLMGDVPVKDCLLSTALPMLEMLPSDIQLAAAEIELVPLDRREYRLKDVLDTIKDDYELILIDCAPSLSLLTLNALAASDSVLLPIQCEYYALEGVRQMMNTLQRVTGGIHPDLDIEGIVLTMLDSRTNLGLSVVEEVKRHFAKEVYPVIIPRSVRLSEAPSHGLPICLYDPRSAGGEAYAKLTTVFLERLAGGKQ